MDEFHSSIYSVLCFTTIIPFSRFTIYHMPALRLNNVVFLQHHGFSSASLGRVGFISFMCSFLSLGYHYWGGGAGSHRYVGVGDLLSACCDCLLTGPV